MRSGSLAVLAAVFLAAFAGRAAVLAEEIAAPGKDAAKPAAPPRPACLTGPLAEELKEGLSNLEARKADIADAEQAAKILREQLDKRIAELEAANAALIQSIDTADRAQNEDARRVAVIYEQMKPQLAGAIIKEMDPQFAAGLLLAMSGESASSVLSALPPERAYAVTVLMAEAP